MARNRFDVDETLETPFNIKHLLRAGVYIKRHKQKMILSLVFSAISAACALVGPKLIETALNVAVPNRDYKMLFILAGIMLLSILLSIFFSVKRSRYMTVVGQAIIYDIRKDLFEHLQRLSFQFYDDRPHGKILTRVINYVNSVSDALSESVTCHENGSCCIMPIWLLSTTEYAPWFSSSMPMSEPFGMTLCTRL